eukprot:TRINITY_DN8402_c0_g1_i1.p1 TRINITY_DN8402_c0_g1~~TRINITY_DN8402_c0_g1_i1.p1  ORF type:complete len:934 (+),score=394.59 TRINITY_DN8402_c0_g1_i1:50-2851(+)
MKHLRLALVALALVGSASAQRQSQNFDFGWLFSRGENPSYVPATCNSTDFPIPMNNIQCFGLQNIPTATDAASCEAACCLSYACETWQWCPGSSSGCNGQGSNGQGCWVGQMTQCTNSTGWISSGRSSAPPEPPPPGPQPCPQSPACAKFDDSDWRQLNVPHDFIVEGIFNETADRNHGYLPFAIGWYRKHFSVPSSWNGQPVYIDFDGVYRASDYFLNGVWVGHHESGYTPFRWYLHNVSGAQLNYGDSATNVLAVHVDALHFQEGWFYEGGGIYRHTTLNTIPTLSVVPWGVYAPAVVLGPITGGPDEQQYTTDALVNVQTDIANAGSNQDYTLVTSILDPSGKVVAAAKSTGTLAAAGWARVQQQLELTGSVLLWNTAATPMYTVNTVLGSDELNTTFGIRTAIFNVQSGLLLNGFPTKIKGLSMHQDFAGCGTAMPDAVNEFRVTSLKAMGANGWRTAHNPVNSELLDFTDRHGILVWSENRNLVRSIIASPRSAPREPHSRATRRTAEIRDADGNVLVGAPPPFPWPFPDPMYLNDAQAMVLRDRNHPSIIIWSLCNEGGCMQGDPLGGIVASAFKKSIYDCDTSRPITANSEDNDGDTLTKVMDVESFSYNYGEYDLFHWKYPWKPLMGGESASCVSDRGYYLATNATGGWVNADDSGCVVQAWQSCAVVDYCAGNFAWTGFDYKGEPSPLNWPDINSHFGIIDIAGFPKDSYGYYAAWWRNDTSVLHILPQNWNSPVPVGSSLTAEVYCNCAQVQLWVNGVSQGKVSVEFLGVATFNNVVFQPGQLRAESYDNNGKLLATATVNTTGAAASLGLSLDVGADGIRADGQDVALVRVAVLDAQGNLVPDANPLVTFSISGPGSIYGVGNGDPSDHDPDKPLNMPNGVFRRAYNGLARVVVQSGASPGTVRLTANSAGLGSASVDIRTA